MIIHRIRSYEEFIEHQEKDSLALEKHLSYLQRATPNKKRKFKVPGYSYTAKKKVDFLVDFRHSGNSGRVNWRERVCCPKTGYNNRTRATFHLFDIEMNAYPASKIYISEQITPVFSYFANKFPLLTGSEFIGNSIPFGDVDSNGVRNEDLRSLSFADKSFDLLITLDVFEHMPNYLLAFKECARVLRSGGKMMWSVPFIPKSTDNEIRAQLVGGKIHHILAPVYHVDPFSDDGILCFQNFGWVMLEQMREAGFKDAYALCYHSIEYGYLGGNQFIFIASK